MGTFSNNMNRHWQWREQKKIFQTIPVTIFCNLTMFQYRFDSPQVKANQISSVKKLINKLSYEPPNDFRLKILRNQEILEKSQIWVESQPSVQFPFHKLKSGNSSKKIAKVNIKHFQSRQIYQISLLLPKQFVQDCWYEF